MFCINRKTFFLFICYFYLYLVTHSAHGYTTTQSDALITSLLTGYNIKTRPVDVVSVTVDFQLTNIQNVDVKTGVFAVTGWWIISWSDSRLTWDPSLNGGITDLVLYQDDIWTPALVVSNSDVNLSAIDDDTIPLRVSNDGSIVWRPPGIIEVGCNLDITNYPFDTHTCYVEMTSFGYSILELDLLTNSGVLMDYYSTSGEWSVKRVYASRSEYEDSLLDYARLTYYVVMSRKPTFYGLNVIFPVIITGLLTLFVFRVHPESGEKLGYSLTIFLTYVVLLSLVATNMPTTATYTSLLEVYIGLILLLSAFAVILSIITLEIYHTDEKKPVPDWLIRATHIGQVIVCNKPQHRVDTSTSSEAHLQSNIQDEAVNEKMGFPRNTNGPLKTESPERRKSPPTSPQHRPTSSNSTRGETPSGDPSDVSWHEVALTFDAVMLRVYAVLITGFSVCFLTIMGTAD